VDARGGRATSVAGRYENGHSFDRAETAADGVGDRHPQEQAQGEEMSNGVRIEHAFISMNEQY
jgi:hypothetical protein